MTLCRLCDDPCHMGDVHPCCERLWNGRYCLSCEASKAFWRTQRSRKKR